MIFHLLYLSVGFVAVNAYIGTMFAPLNYLGTVYSTIIKGIVDVTNLAELLSESPDVVDVAGAKPLLGGPSRRGDAPMAVSTKLTQHSCSNCGTKVMIVWKFCPSCSAPVSIAAKLKSFGENTGLPVEFKGMVHQCFHPYRWCAGP